jgi:hypothetical protein
VVGWVVVAGFGLLWLWPLGSWVARRTDIHPRYWTLLALLQGSLVVQVVAGLVLLALGRRQSLLHYLYGSFFPVLVLTGAHVVARDLQDEHAPWKVFGIATFIVFGLTLRALTTGLGLR